MDNDLRAPWMSRGTKIAAGVTIGGLVIVFGVLPRYVAWSDRREREAKEAAEAPFRAEQAKLEQQLAARFAGLPMLTGDVPPHCPPQVTGDLPVLQRERLAYALSRDAKYPDGPLLSSPALLYWTNAWTPSLGDTTQLAKKSQAERDLLAAKYVVLTTAGASPVHSTSEHVFEGGEVMGTLVVVDVAAKAIACASVIDTQPEFVVAVKQDSAEGDRWAMQSAERDAIADAFWTGLDAQLARMTAGAKAVRER